MSRGTRDRPGGGVGEILGLSFRSLSLAGLSVTPGAVRARPGKPDAFQDRGQRIQHHQGSGRSARRLDEPLA